MTDRELLELAAKAAGVDLGVNIGGSGDSYRTWNPLADDDAAFQLAIDLQIQFGVVLEDSRGWAESHERYIDFEWDMHRPGDRYAATRRAITRAAAAIGEAM